MMPKVPPLPSITTLPPLPNEQSFSQSTTNSNRKKKKNINTKSRAVIAAANAAANAVAKAGANSGAYVPGYSRLITAAITAHQIEPKFVRFVSNYNHTNVRPNAPCYNPSLPQHLQETKEALEMITDVHKCVVSGYDALKIWVDYKNGELYEEYGYIKKIDPRTTPLHGLCPNIRKMHQRRQVLIHENKKYNGRKRRQNDLVQQTLDDIFEKWRHRPVSDIDKNKNKNINKQKHKDSNSSSSTPILSSRNRRSKEISKRKKNQPQRVTVKQKQTTLTQNSYFDQRERPKVVYANDSAQKLIYSLYFVSVVIYTY